MGNRALQNNFLGGIISSSMMGRTDNTRFRYGAFELENFIVEPQGSLINRPGFEYVGEAKDSSKPLKLIPFRFASDQTLVLVFGDKTLRFATHGQWVLDGSKVYEIESPYAAEDLYTLDYSQNADIITLTSSKYPPMELRRYGATDWQFTTVTTLPGINPPSAVTVEVTYPPDALDDDKGTVIAKYVVTAVDANGKESIASSEVEVKCNYYLTGSYNTISWTAVAGAERYRIYRSVAGIFGFLGETTGTQIMDEGDFTPDTTYTPPLYANPFLDHTGIKEVKVINGGSGYPNTAEVLNSANPTELLLRMPPMYYSSLSSNKPFWGDNWDANAAAILTFAVIDGATGRELASADVRYIPIAYHTQRGQERTWERQLYLPDTYDINHGLLKLNFSGYSSTDSRLKIVKWKWDGDSETTSPPSFIEYFMQSGGTHTYTVTHQSSSSGGGTWEETLSISVPDLNITDWTLKNGMTATMLGEVLSWRLMPGFAGMVVKGGNGGSIATILTENGDDIEQTLKEHLVQIEIDDPTGEGAVLRPIIENGVITSVEVVNSGVNYTNPTLTVVSEQGSGAVLEAVLFDEEDYDYPAANTQYDQRRIFAGTMAHPLRVWMTNAGQQDLMMYHLPVMSDDRIEIEAVTADADMIRHAVALDSLILFTGSGELRVFTQNSDALAPDSVAVRAQSYIGANDVQPVICNQTIVYGASRGGHAWSVDYQYSVQGYSAVDRSTFASHLFDGKELVDMAYQKSPYSIVWAVSSDGSLLGLTFMPDENVQAWHRHTTDGVFENVCVVAEGKEDRLYAVVRRNINGKELRYIERMGLIREDRQPYFRNFDSYIATEQQETTLNSGDTLTGLSHLEGKTIGAIVDGTPQPEAVVKNGKAVVRDSGSNVAAGLPYKCRLITVPLTGGDAAPVQGVVKNVSELHLRVRFAGDVWANLYPLENLYRCKREITEFKRQNPDSQMVRLTITNAWDYSSQIQIEHRDCLNLQIQALVSNVRVEN